MVNPGFVPEQQPPQQQGNGIAVAGMVLGICALVFCWIPFLNWVLGLLGIIFGALGISRGNKVGTGKGMALAGLICGIIGSLLGIALVVLVFSAGKAIERGFEKGMHDVAVRDVQRYANEAYPMWARNQPDKACPASLSELNDELGRMGTLDPWGNPYKMMCGADLPPGAHGIAVMSPGPDGKEGTADDIKSWE